MKKYTVRFYRGNALAAETPADFIADALRDEAQRHLAGAPTLHDAPPVQYELRDLESINSGAVIAGSLAVLRDDAPHIRTSTGAERPVELQDNEFLIEKNFFVYYCARRVLVWQVNGRASHISRMERFVSALTGEQHACAFDDILSPSAHARLAEGIVKRVQLRFASMKNPEAVDPNHWESGAFELMSGADATSVEVTVGTRRRKKGLSDQLKSMLHRVVNREDVRAVRVRLEGEDQFIDLLADCLQTQITVRMQGRYPLADDIFGELNDAYHRQQPVLDEVLGSGSSVLV